MEAKIKIKKSEKKKIFRERVGHQPASTTTPSTQVSDKKHSVKTALPARILLCTHCRVWHSAKLYRVYLGLCRVLETLGKASVSRSDDKTLQES